MLLKKRFIGFTLALTLAGFIGKAQNCKFDVDKNDEFTNKRKVSSTLNIGPKTLNGDKHLRVFWTVTVTKNGDDYSLNLLTTVFGKRDDIFSKGEKLLAKLADGSIIEFTAGEDAIPSFIVNSLGAFTQLNIHFNTDAATLNKIASSNLTVLRLKVGSLELDATIAENKAEKLTKLASCILQSK